MILTKIAEGSRHLTSVRLLAPHLRPDDYRELLDEASGKTKQEVKEQVAALAPRPDIPMTVRWLAEPATAPQTSTATPASPPPAPRLEMTPLSPGRCQLAFAANRSTYDKFVLIKDVERRKNGATDRPRPGERCQYFSSILRMCPSVDPTFWTVWMVASLQANVPAFRCRTSGWPPSVVTFAAQSVK
jgi:hypothetical protein